ncbi:HesA/MoeB/ThiF family protein [Pseudaestuariivita sp.]|uniref:HesA/MoeB/ThiF family protein n=1 Tax=Pseudaestuariivita sp. TaxID=2211669 RepID=UPI004059CCA0
MLLVLAMMGALWGVGALTGASRAARLTMILILLSGVILAHFALPEGNALRMATGESAAPWLMLIGLGALVLAYRGFLRRLRARATPETPAVDLPTQSGTFSEAELDRYSRHIMLREIGGAGQKRLKAAKVLVIGAGGLGSPALQYLAAAGVGTLGVIDDDVVENSNLQRQTIHTDARLGMPKVHSAAAAIADQNPYVTVRPYNRKITEEIARELIADYDIVLDGTDDTAARYVVNAACVAERKTLVSGALSQWEGQVAVFDPAFGGPCYKCVFPEPAAPGSAPTCAEAGVLGPLPGVVGAMMAVEAVKMVTDAGTPLRGQMLIYDALYGETRTITLKRDPNCPVCGTL